MPHSWCEECDLTIRTARRAAEQVGDVEVKVKPWFNHLFDALRRGGWHAPVLTIDGKIFSQGIAGRGRTTAGADGWGARMNRRNWLAETVLFAAALAVACGGDDDTAGVSSAATAAPATTVVAAVVTASPTPTTGEIDHSVFDRPFTEREELIFNAIGGRYSETNWAIRSINLDDLIPGGPGKDGIPALNEPQFISHEEAARMIEPQSPVIALEVNGEVRAYPIDILIRHEIVNDVIGGVPVAVTFCPLCNTSTTFDRRVDGEERPFGVSGLVRVNDLVMFDRTDESFWQQITGEAIVGDDTGKRLTMLASQIVSWAEFDLAHPDAVVLSRSTGYRYDYGRNPYSGYDRVGSSPMFPLDEDFDGKERVLTVEIDGDAGAFPFASLSTEVVMETDVAGQPVVAFWQSGAVSALDESFIIGSRNIGAAGAFSPFLDGERLTFESRDGAIVDTKTGTVWDVLGKARTGGLAGAALDPVISGNHFWFAWATFMPETKIIIGNTGG
ncbi:MAG TPA: DUF3179 domain-containing protein [Dehalococcoidia bacterium]|nr:DUF3179 domain-containing protein [Dehalococcoidia bacterium]